MRTLFRLAPLILFLGAPVLSLEVPKEIPLDVGAPVLGGNVSSDEYHRGILTLEATLDPAQDFTYTRGKLQIGWSRNNGLAINQVSAGQGKEAAPETPANGREARR